LGNGPGNEVYGLFHIGHEGGIRYGRKLRVYEIIRRIDIGEAAVDKELTGNRRYIEPVGFPEGVVEIGHKGFIGILFFPPTAGRRGAIIHVFSIGYLWGEVNIKAGGAREKRT
jgi:hypothetical protein